ncbi:thiamine-phosphate kinase [Erythrobacter sanguineus]|uniref:Thiamine-monophosphate kinase n=1 Tax=Erythrobacter sanguineus TaxID=198312 RepID=A0A1M7RQB0_9SPHN|nr:thiamine-phosphate kinase [Erythrobacter sanguineus]SHN48464.1 thiamine-phosphate kinase [Erythrobacter sanguineus]
MNESEFIAALRKLPLHPGARGLEDDCAVLTIGGETLVITHDMMAEDTHFLSHADMADVAWKLLAANLSDLAAKGAGPIGVLLGHSLGSDDARFLAGLDEGLRTYGVPIMGGDTVATTGTSTYGMTAIGRAAHLPVPSRKGAQPGDGIHVTGPVGRAMLGFEGDEDHLQAFNRPVPRLAEGIALAPHVSAMMDISDGLLLDCWRMAWVSGVTLAIDSAVVPVASRPRMQECMRWGDDYELLFTAPEGAALPVPAFRIGTVRPRGSAPLLLDEAPLADPANLGYRHG